MYVQIQTTHDKNRLQTKGLGLGNKNTRANHRQTKKQGQKHEETTSKHTQT